MSYRDKETEDLFLTIAYFTSVIESLAFWLITNNVLRLSANEPGFYSVIWKMDAMPTAATLEKFRCEAKALFKNMEISAKIM